MPEKNPFLTVPEELPPSPPIILTGNEYLSLPEIDSGGGVASLNVLLLSSRGLLEFAGEAGREGDQRSRRETRAATPLLAPNLAVAGQEVNLGKSLAWSYAGHWIPRFRGRGAGWALEGEIAAPPGQKGAVYRLAITGTGCGALPVEMGFSGSWKNTDFIIFKRRPTGAARVIRPCSWTKSLVLEARSGLPLAALALAVEPEGEWITSEEDGRFATSNRFILQPGETRRLDLYLAVNLEGDGAGTTAVDLRRRGAGALAGEARSRLAAMTRPLADRALARALNRNLFFNYYFALGRALDTDDLVPVTSRSPRYYVSAAFWGRDALLWSFPGILLADPAAAREMLEAVFRRHLHHAGDHAHYINGVILYPGFELDQLAAYFLAVERYEAVTGDLSLPQETLFREGLAYLAARAADQKEPAAGLYRTFLDPSDDPVNYPFLVYGNALLWRAFTWLARLQREGRWSHPVPWDEAAAELREAIMRHGVVPGPEGPMFAWAVNGRGGFELYDNPPGSLLLLPYYGFCPREDPVFQNTARWIRSAGNPYHHGDCPFPGRGSRHCGKPWPMAAANAILAGFTEEAGLLRRASMDHGFCCETVDPDTGRAATGAAFASAAGFLAHALWTAFGSNLIKGKFNL